jgi:hypothetical protein
MVSGPRWLAFLACLCALPSSTAIAELVSLEWHTCEPFAGGEAFGDVGPYDKVVGVARFAVDPNHARNKVVVDLENAPRNEKGLVEFAADVFLLRPRDLSRGNGALLYEVSNRGKKEALNYFNDAKLNNNPSTVDDAGHGFLFRQGYTLLWSGWMGDLLPGEHRMLLHCPVARNGAQPITGIVRYEMVADVLSESMPLSGRGDHGNYSPSERGEREGVLTWRLHQNHERVVIPRSQWTLERLKVPEVDRGVPGTLGQTRLKLSGGFRPGYIYELVCEAEGPIVQGLGFAAVRDLVSFLKYDDNEQNPLLNDKKPAITRAHGFGISQCGRFLRHFLYQGFNADEHDRRVFDGMMPLVSGGGLVFANHRFAQPSRHNGQHKEHYYPADVFPFTYGDSTDEYIVDGKPHSRGEPDGILRRLSRENAGLVPKIIHVHSSSEYWHRSGSLVHTNTQGTADASIPPEVRIFVIGGTQHNPASFPPGKAGADNHHNPGDYRPHLRALLQALDAWVRGGTEPPASVYPRISDKTLVDWRQSSTGFPSLPGIRYPQVIQQPSALDLGPDFRQKGVITIEPPRLLGDYVVLTPKSDPDGIDLGCLRPVEVAAPVATHTGWNLRSSGVGAEGELASLSVGSYIPFPRTEAEARATGDPRESLEKRYGSFAGYRKRWEAARDELIKGRYLLAEDAERLEKRLERVRELFPSED